MLLRDLHSSELWTDMLQRGILEYIDPWELLEYRVAMQPKDLMGLSEADLAQFTHMAVHPCAILGTSSCTVPWSDHNQAPRVS